MQQARGALCDRGAVGTQAEALSPGLSADELDAVVVDEVREHTDGIGPATDAGHDGVGELSGALEDLRARLGGDDAVEFLHDFREWVWAGRGAQQVVGFVEGGGPVAQRLVHGVLQRARAGFHADNLRAHEAHAVDVRRLALHVGLAHVDHALEAQQRAREGGGGPVLARARLRDDPRLAHLLGQERLADHLVSLVRATVDEVLPLEENAGVALQRQVAALGERGRAAEVVAQQPAVLRHELVVVERVDEGALELVQRRDERLGDELSPKLAVVSR